MAQNITNDPAFKKLMTPQMPPLSGEVEFPTLDAIAQQTAAQVNGTPPPLSGVAEIPNLNTFDSLTDEPFNPNVTQPVANLGTPAVTDDGRITSASELSDFMAGLNKQAGLPRTQMPTPQMASPESVAGLSITGSPLTQGAITSPQLPQTPQPQVPNITTPAPAAGQLSGMITRDSTGQQFGLNEGGNLRELNPTEGAALQGDLDRRRAAREAQVMQTFGQMTPEQLTEQRQIGAQAQFARLSPAEQANVQAGRPPNVSEAQVGQAQTEAVARQADYEQRQINRRIEDQMDRFKEENPMATTEQITKQQEVLAKQESLAQKGEAIPGASALDQAKIRKTEAETAKVLSEIGSGKGANVELTPIEKSRDTEAGKELSSWESTGRATIESNIGSLSKVIDSLETGQIKTRGFIDALPFGADWARAIVNPTGQDAKDRVQGVIFQTLRETLGAQFTEREGQRLVEASYNTKLSPEQNAARLRDYVGNLSAAAKARDSQIEYMTRNRTLKGYQGPDPEALMLRGIGGEQGSPIKGDVNYQSEVQGAAQGILDNQ